VILSAVAIAAALGLVGCGADSEEKQADAAVETQQPITPLPPVPEPEGADPAVPPLPSPGALADVMNRISDASIPGADKMALIESATSRDAESMDRFGKALTEGGYAQVTWEAKDLRWANGTTGNVLAVLTLKAANPQTGDFAFPMEFNTVDNSWQLTRRTADALLQPGEAAPPVPTPTPTP
jgi:hypothetical protein